MEQQLKQRLIGVTIVVALVVIFVPMLFDQSDDKGKLSAIGIPAIPDDVMEKTIELPKTAEDLAPKESEGEGEGEGKPAESGYRIVPLNNEPPPAKPKPTDRLAAQPKTPVEEDMGEKPVDPEDVDNPRPLESGAKENKVNHPARANVLKSPVVDKPSASLKPGLDTQQPTSTPRKARHGTPKHTPLDTEPNAHGDAQDAQVTSPVKIDHPASKKLNAQTGMEARHTEHTETVPRKEAASKKLETIKSAHPLVKASKPKTSTPSPAEADRDLEEDDIPIPVKPEIPQTKPKSLAGNALPSKASLGKSTTPPKPSVTEHPTPKTTKPEPSTVDAVTPPPAKPKVVKPALTPADADPQPVAKPKAVKPAPSTAEVDTPPAAKPKAVKPAPSTVEVDTPPAKPKAVKPTPVPAPATAKPVKPVDTEKPKPQTMAPSEWPVLARCETDTALPQAFSARIDMRGS